MSNNLRRDQRHACELCDRMSQYNMCPQTVSPSPCPPPENDRPMKGLRQEDLVNQDLITELRKDFGMTHDDFYMVLSDADMRVKVTTALRRRGAS